ncbi:MAG TPA: hypothetical protein VLE95_01965 [Chlamydiales bacterium]|nr:hypothetical protein [Chlamydiales bacterium]
MTPDSPFWALGQLISLLINCAILEKGISMYQNRLFKKRSAFGLFLIFFAIEGSIYAIAFTLMYKYRSLTGTL